MTDREKRALLFLDDKLHATAQMVGRAVYRPDDGGGSNIGAIGGAIMGRLRKRGLVWAIEPGLWRISTKGRAALSSNPTS